MTNTVEEKKIDFHCGGEILSGLLITPRETKPSSGILFLHGAGKATKERSQPLAIKLAEKYGISSFLFDFSGHGASTGNIETSSLKKRVAEAVKAFEASGFSEPISICAFSMGGHIALELLPKIYVQNLILFYSAVYTDKAFEIEFGDPKFSELIRIERSWESSATFDNLNKLKGRLILFMGDNDEIIPMEVPNKIMSKANEVSKKELVILKNAGHLLLPVIFNSEELLNEVCEKISASVSTAK